MKKLNEILRPFFEIILGALILLMNLNNLQGENEVLAYGIIAMVLAAFYISIGVIGLTLNNRLSGSAKKVLEIGAVVAFPVFMFVYFLLSTINLADYLGPNGWFLAVLKMVASICFALTFLLAGILKNRHINKMALLFASIFILVLLLEVLFDQVGNPIGLGGVVIVEVVVYFIYGNILFNSFSNFKVGPQQNDQPAEAEEAEDEEETETPAEE